MQKLGNQEHTSIALRHLDMLAAQLASSKICRPRPVLRLLGIPMSLRCVDRAVMVDAAGQEVERALRGLVSPIDFLRCSIDRQHA